MISRPASYHVNMRFFAASIFFLLLINVSVAQKSNSSDLFAYYKAEWKQTEQPSSFSVIHHNRPLPERVKVFRQITGDISIISTSQIDLIPSSQVIQQAAADNKWKLSSQALQDKFSDEQTLIVSGNDLVSLVAFVMEITGKNAVLKIDTASKSVLLKSSGKNISLFLSNPLVTFVDVQPTPATEVGIIGYDPGFHGINELTALHPSANGRNIVVGVKEQKMEPMDLDLYQRIIPSSIASSTVSSHATVISSIIGGAGNSYYDGLGIANACSFFSSSFADLFADDISVLRSANVSVQNHSYGTIIQSFYGAEALSYDAQSWTNNIQHVFSAGNQGRAAAAEGKYAGIQGYANLTGNFKTAKNVITIGAIDNKGNLVAESSAGPLYDGRLAPQLIALGPNGTSDAAAMVSGTIAVLQQVYADSNQNTLPSTALIKAGLYSTADDIHSKGIDHKTGYGLLNTFNAVRLIQQKNYFNAVISPGRQWSSEIRVPSNISQLKLTLCWNDEPAAVNNLSALINDLDLELVEQNTGRIYHPWILSSFPLKDSLEKLPVRGRDSLNTAEQVSIELPGPGTYRINVYSRPDNTTDVSFAVAWFTDTRHSFRFTSPQQAADINPENNPSLSIRWTTTMTDPEQKGDLFVSYDKGVSWRSIAQGLSLASRLFEWMLPDTSSVARLMMRTGSGEFSSADFVVSKLIRPQPDFVCSDSFRLSWAKHVYAESYTVFLLADSSHLKPLINTRDTFVVINRKKNPSLVYAVQPILSNNLPAARSIAMNIELQGVQCFFRTLNYILENENQLKMILELSTTSGVDSIFFERVTTDGNFLQSLGSMQASIHQLEYVKRSEERIAGTIYIRARIRLKSGVFVYTDIIEVLSSGSKNILFYPNPVRQSSRLSYIMKQGISPDCRLQIFDLFGRTVRQYISLPTSIDVSGLLPGTYIFKISDRSGKQIEITKQVIQ
jgi:hypothetical protein